MNFLKILFISLVLNSFTYAANAEKLVIVADEWCPYNCALSNEKPGFMIEIAKKVFAEHGYEVEYKVMPWSRAIEGVRYNKYQGLIATTTQETPDFVFPYYSQAFNKYNIYTSPKNDWQYDGVASLEDVRLGIIADYGYGHMVNEYIKENKGGNLKVQTVSGNNAMRYNIRKLRAGRVDAYIENEYVIEDYFSSIDEKNPFKNAGWVKPVDIDQDLLYIAISPNHPEAGKLARILSQGTQQLRETGELQKILGKYGLQDWFGVTSQ